MPKFAGKKGNRKKKRKMNRLSGIYVQIYKSMQKKHGERENNKMRGTECK